MIFLTIIILLILFTIWCMLRVSSSCSRFEEKIQDKEKYKL